MPSGAVALFWPVTAPTTNPAAAMSASAPACGCPTTSGTVPTDAGPSETTRSIPERGATSVPATGLWLITASSGTVGLFRVAIAPTARFAAAIVAAAALCWPTTSGTVTASATCDGIALQREKAAHVLHLDDDVVRSSCVTVGVHRMSPEAASIAMPAGAVGSEKVRMSPAIGIGRARRVDVQHTAGSIRDAASM